jgi:hypothetical protein
LKDIQIGDIEAEAPSAWAIRGVIGGLSIIWGETGSYKTFLAIGMGVCVAAGVPWFGARVKQGPVLYLLGEGGQDLFRRRAGMAAQHFKVDLTDLPLWVRAEAVNMADPGRLEPYMNGWDHIMPSLVIIDTLSRSLPGDENKQETMQGFVACMDALRDRFDASVLALHHSGKSGDVRGSTVLPGAVDVEIAVQKETVGQDKVLRLRPEKLRDLDVEGFANTRLIAKSFDVRDSKNNLVLDEYGDKVTTLVITAGEDFTALASDLLRAFSVLKLSRVKGDWVGFKEWYEEWSKGGYHARDVATFKIGLNEILLYPETYGIVVVNPVHPENAVMPGKNWDVEEDEERQKSLQKLMEER